MANAKKALSIALSAALTSWSAGLASAASDPTVINSNPDQVSQQRRIEQVQMAMEHWPDNPSLGDVVNKLHVPLDLVAKIHPMPASSYTGATLRDKAVAARMALLQVGKIIDQAKEDLNAQDQAQKYVLDAANKAVNKVADGYNKFLGPASEKLDHAEDYITDMAGALYTVAAMNNAATNSYKTMIRIPGGYISISPDPQCNFAKSRAMLIRPLAPAVQVAFLSTLLGEGVAEAQCGSQQKKPLSTTASSGKSSQFDPVLAQTGRGIVNIARSELPLVELAETYRGLAGNAVKEAQSLAAEIDGELAAAEAIKKVMAMKDGEYRHDMKGSAAEARKSELVVELAIKAMRDFKSFFSQTAGKLDSLINGSLTNAIAKVKACTLKNIEVGKLMQTDDPDAHTAAEIITAQKRNIDALKSLEALTPDYDTALAMKGGRVMIAQADTRHVEGISALDGHESPTVNGTKPLNATKKGGAALIRDAYRDDAK